MYKCGLLLLLFILVCNYSFAQNVSVKHFKKLFNETRNVEQIVPKNVRYADWVSPNDNDEYYNNDTLCFYWHYINTYNPGKYLDNKPISCKQIVWRIYRKNFFYLYTHYGCEYLHGAYVSNPDNFQKKFIFFSRNQNVYMHICSNDSLENCFLVSSIETISDTSLPNKNYKIILIRKK